MNPGHLRELIAAELPALRAVRHDLHAHPELGYDEHRTSQVIQDELSRLGVAFKAGLAGGTGVVAHLPATAPASGTASDQAVGIRADIDALPITEQTGLGYASRHHGRMHACGHDGHTAIVLGVARVLQKLPRPWPVTLVFQPAEEGGGGADRLCREGLIEGGIIGPPIARMFGLHGWPDLQVGTVATRPGPLLASTDEFHVRIRGTQAHAAYPHLSRDPVVCLAHCISALQTVVSRAVPPQDSAVVSVCTLQAGTATNIIPETAELGGTLRTLRAGVRAACKKRMYDLLQGVCDAHDCVPEIDWREGYPVTHNDPAATERFFAVARDTLGPDRVGVIEHPTMGGEDFSYYAQRVPSVFFCLGLKRPGQERCPSLHQPDFDFNDEAMPTGIEMFTRLATAQ